MNWCDISYLQKGSEIQQKAFQCLSELHLLEILSRYHPILTGTIPIDIAIESSDLDVACQFSNSTEFEFFIKDCFGSYQNFISYKKIRLNQPIVVGSFLFRNFTIEIYGAELPVEKQNSYRHMLIENRILLLLGQEFKSQVIQLKQTGWKTEPAFAQLLQISGDPYQNLLNFESLSDQKIITIWRQSIINT